MIFIVLNLILAAFFIAELIYQDKEERGQEEIDPFIVNFYLIIIILFFYILALSFSAKMTMQLLNMILKISLFLEYCMLVNISFCFLQKAAFKSRKILQILKILLYAFAWWVVVKKIQLLSISENRGIIKDSEELIFPLTWEECFKIFLFFIFPLFSSLVLILTNLRKTRLLRFLSAGYFASALSMWIMEGAIFALSLFNREYSYLHYFAYLPLFIIMPLTFKQKSSPSPKVIKNGVKQALFLFLFPAVAYSLASSALYVFLGENFKLFLPLLVLLTFFFMTSLQKIAKKMKIDTSFKVGFYEKRMEKDLSLMDYSLGMEENAKKMFSIVQSNMDSSFLETYIANGNNSFLTAYSSKGREGQLLVAEELLGFLIENGLSVVTYNQIKEDEYKFAASQKPLMKMLDENGADALILLHEGRALHGFIMLGVAKSGERFREYDAQVLTRLYPYFFVFGYYMRNIANKDILSVIDRELKMSSQIITSIQENMDMISSEKLETGALMKASYNIGGEFIDMIRLTSTRHLLVVADLSGRGIAASMSMVIFKAMIRAYLEETHDFKQLVVKLNAFVKNNLMKGTVCQAMFAILDYKNDKFYYINCGVPAIFLYTEAFKNVIEVQGEGHYLGFVDDISPYISVKQIELKKNDVLLTCTKGLVKSHSLRGESYGKERVQRMIVENRTFPASRLVRFVYDDLIRFMSHEMEYDVSIFALKYKGE